MKSKQLVLIALNEINFDIIDYYIEKNNLKNLKKLKEFSNVKTSSENEYNYLEPWIQWTSINTGLKAKDHKIFHLGDSSNLQTTQIFEKIEKNGFSVGAISPMNALNKLINPMYFIPDPWTETKCDQSFLSKCISETFSITVKNNSSLKFNLNLIIKLLFIFFSVVRFKKYYLFFSIFLKSINKNWYRVIFFDLLINEIHIRYLNKYNPNFSTVFFNGGAHIQHHYFLSSKALDNNLKNPYWYINKYDDPLEEITKYYDIIISDYIKSKKFDFILATGLRQIPIDKPKYYWKLRDYKNFLKYFDINCKKIQQLMSRDFIIQFEHNNQDLIDECYKKLKKIMIMSNNEKLKAFENIEKRVSSIFVTLTFSKELYKESYFFMEGENKKISCIENVEFVAIKNGIHNSIGYLFTNIRNLIIHDKMHVKDVFKLIVNYFIEPNETKKI